MEARRLGVKPVQPNMVEGASLSGLFVTETYFNKNGFWSKVHAQSAKKVNRYDNCATWHKRQYN
jgi:hypothetical protein